MCGVGLDVARFGSETQLGWHKQRAVKLVAHDRGLNNAGGERIRDRRHRANGAPPCHRDDLPVHHTGALSEASGRKDDTAGRGRGTQKLQRTRRDVIQRRATSRDVPQRAGILRARKRKGTKHAIDTAQ